MSKIDNRLKKESILVHGGQEPDPVTGAVAVPIYQTTSYRFESARQAGDVFALKQAGNIYTRLTNPTNEVFEKRMALLDGGVAALAFASGAAAVANAVLNITQSGDEIVSADNLYGGTYTFFKHILKKYSIKANFVKANDIEAFKKAITPRTKAIFAETIDNPKVKIADIEALAKVAHDNGIPLIIDNTLAAYICRPIEHGADIVVYSATKIIGGHGTTLGGVIVDSGNFDWTNGKFPVIADADESYHNLNFVEAFGKAAYIMKARAVLLRDTGPALSPFNSFLLLQGLESLHVRIERHCQNALKVAEFLEKHPLVGWVNYPGLKSSPENAKAEKYLGGNGGCVIGFGVKGGMEASKKFIDSVELAIHLANMCDAKTLVIHPASTTHAQQSEQELADSGITQDYIRLSVGIENVEDIIEDLDNALKKSQI